MLQRRYHTIFVFLIITAIFVVGVLAIWNASRWLDRPFPGFLIGKAGNVYPLTAPDWSFHKMHLAAHDKLVSIEGQPIKKAVHFASRMTNFHYNDRIQCLFSRNGYRISRVARVQKFSFRDFFYTFLVPFIIGIVYLASGTAVYIYQPGMTSARIFALFCGAIGIILISFFDTFTDYRFLHLSNLALYSLPGLLFHLALVFPEKTRTVSKHPYLPLAVYLPGLLVWYSKGLYELSNFTTWTYFDISGDLLILAAYLTFLIRLLIGIRRASTSILRSQARLLFTGMILGFLIPGASIMLITTQNITSVNIAFLISLIFPLFLGYSVTRFNLFAAQRFIISGFLYSVLSVLAFLLFLLISSLLGAGIAGYDSLARFISTFLFLLLIFTIFAALQRKFQKFIQQKSDRSQYSLEDKLKNLGIAFSALFRVTDDTLSISRNFFSHFHIASSALILFESSHIFPGISEHQNTHSNHQLLFQKHPQIQNLEAMCKRGCLSLHDLEHQSETIPGAAWMRKLFEEHSAILLFPLCTQQHLHGLLLISEKSGGQSFSSNEINIVQAFASRIATACMNTLFTERIQRQQQTEQELQRAKEIQESLLPAHTPTGESFSLCSAYHPARFIGGDLFDFYQKEDTLKIAIGDVSGHGIPAALFAATVCGLLKADWPLYNSNPELMAFLKKQLARRPDSPIHLGLCTASFDWQEHRLRIANAGMPFPVCLPAEGGEAFLLHCPGMFLTLSSKPQPRLIEKEIASNDLFLFYSDGLVEARNNAGEKFGFDRLCRTVSDCPTREPGAVIEYIMKKLNHFRPGQWPDDDIAILALRVNALP